MPHAAVRGRRAGRGAAGPPRHIDFVLARGGMSVRGGRHLPASGRSASPLSRLSAPCVSDAEGRRGRAAPMTLGTTGWMSGTGSIGG
eukprot:6416543-Alexandrium_andersonii.AAC.1